MPTHQVEVDDEIFTLVKNHAEPLVDNFNSSLRRLLQLDIKPGEASTAITDPPVFPGGTPKALRQIIEVVLLVQDGSYSRSIATQIVAKRYRVATQTVLDKYARQLGLTTHQFDRLLDQADLRELKQLLKSKFPSHADDISRLVP